MRIISDSSLDIPQGKRDEYPITKVPFSVRFDDKTYVDTDDVDLKAFEASMVKSKTFQSACPSPNDFYESFNNEDMVFGITITSKLSGSYNSAILAKNLYMEEFPTKRVHIFDSLSASTGPFLTYLRIREGIKAGKSFEDIIADVSGYIAKMETMFISQSLDNLIKAGRMSNMKGFIAKALNIVPIMGATDGVIELFDKARGQKRAFDRLIDIMGERGGDLKDRIIAISHADFEDQAIKLKAAIEKKFKPKRIYILKMGALTTLYADRKGIIISF